MKTELAALERRYARAYEALARKFAGVAPPDSRGERSEPHLPYLIDLAGLTPESRVLDIGCGIGLLTDELAGYLSSKGSYVGMDVREGPLRKLERRYADVPNFRFEFADLRNGRYNARGAEDARTYRFPAETGSIDVVALRSIFTHLLPPEIEHYVREIAQVLRADGAAYITAYLLNDEARAFVKDRSADQPGSFPHDYGAYAVRFDGVPEKAVAIDEGFLRDALSETGLAVREPISYGSWCGRRTFLSRQDVLVASRQPE
jgi:SAM-dependent methyltransferase